MWLICFIDFEREKKTLLWLIYYLERFTFGFNLCQNQYETEWKDVN